MSSLAISLLLLFIAAIGLVLFYNLRQSTCSRWLEVLRRWLPQRLGGEGRGAPESRPAARAAQVSRNPSRPRERGEPRLSASGPLDPDEDETFDPATFGEADMDQPTQPIPSADSSPASLNAAPAHAGSAHAADIASRAQSPEEFAEPPVARAADRAAALGAASAAAPAAAPGGSAVVQRLSEICDCIVEITPASSWSGERLIPLVQRFRRAGSKPVSIEALAQSGSGAQEWHSPMAGHAYDRIRVGILLANRHGPLNAMEFSEFATGVQALAESLSASVSMPAMGTVLARARDLDATCAQLDAQIGVNVDAPEAIEPAQLAALAAKFAIVERGSHRYVRPGPQGEAVFTVTLAEAPNRVTFLLDVPRASPSLEPWKQMVECALACAQRLGARLADDGGRPLTQPGLAQIARQLGQRYDSLDAIGLPAGSPLALKVFN